MGQGPTDRCIPPLAFLQHAGVGGDGGFDGVEHASKDRAQKKIAQPC